MYRCLHACMLHTCVPACVLSMCTCTCGLYMCVHVYMCECMSMHVCACHICPIQGYRNKELTDLGRFVGSSSRL